MYQRLMFVFVLVCALLVVSGPEACAKTGKSKKANSVSTKHRSASSTTKPSGVQVNKTITPEIRGWCKIVSDPLPVDPPAGQKQNRIGCTLVKFQLPDNPIPCDALVNNDRTHGVGSWKKGDEVYVVSFGSQSLSPADNATGTSETFFITKYHPAKKD